MTPQDLESLAEEARARAGLGPREWAPPTKVARLCGYRVILVPNLRTRGMRGTVNGERIIGIRASLPYGERQDACGHEHFHDLFDDAGVKLEPEFEEAACDYGSAALVIPRGFVRDDAEELAVRHKTSETLANLRIGEVLGEPVAVVAPLTVRARGEAQWPEKTLLRAWARSPRPGLKSVRLHDDRSRFLIRVA